MHFPRKIVRALAVAGAVSALALNLSATVRAQATADPAVIKIVRCSITKPRPFSHHPTGTQIDYVNTGPTVVHHVTFRVGYRNAADELTRTFDDAGTFAPNEPVNHHFDTYTDVEYAGSATTSCVVTAVR